jgi:hypothetical protein
MSITIAEESSLCARLEAALTRTGDTPAPPLPQLRPDGDTYLGTLSQPLRHLWLCIEELRREAALGNLPEERNKTTEELVLESEAVFDHLLLISFPNTRHGEVLHIRACWLVVSRSR